jgi:hypothetical protein
MKLIGKPKKNIKNILRKLCIDERTHQKTHIMLSTYLTFSIQNQKKVINYQYYN